MTGAMIPDTDHRSASGDCPSVDWALAQAVGPDAKLVLVTIASHQDKAGGQPRLATGYIADTCGMDLALVDVELRGLAAAGLIEADSEERVTVRSLTALAGDRGPA